MGFIYKRIHWTSTVFPEDNYNELEFQSNSNLIFTKYDRKRRGDRQLGKQEQSLRVDYFETGLLGIFEQQTQTVEQLRKRKETTDPLATTKTKSDQSTTKLKMRERNHKACKTFDSNEILP